MFPPNSYVSLQYDGIDIWRLGPLGNNWVWMKSWESSPQDGIGALVRTPSAGRKEHCTRAGLLPWSDLATSIP